MLDRVVEEAHGQAHHHDPTSRPHARLPAPRTRDHHEINHECPAREKGPGRDAQPLRRTCARTAAYSVQLDIQSTNLSHPTPAMPALRAERSLEMLTQRPTHTAPPPSPLARAGARERPRAVTAAGRDKPAHAQSGGPKAAPNLRPRGPMPPPLAAATDTDEDNRARPPPAATARRGPRAWQPSEGRRPDGRPDAEETPPTRPQVARGRLRRPRRDGRPRARQAQRGTAVTEPPATPKTTTTARARQNAEARSVEGCPTDHWSHVGTLRA